MKIEFDPSYHTVTAHINTEDTTVGEATYKKNTVNGYYHQRDINPITHQIQQLAKFTFQHCDTCNINCGEYTDSFLAIVKDHKNYYGKRYQNVKFSHGNMIHTDAQNHRRSVGAFIAIYDDEFMVLEVRFHNGDASYFRCDSLMLNANNQRVQSHAPNIPSPMGKIPMTVEKLHHGNSKLTVQDEENLLEDLKKGTFKTKALAEKYGVKDATIRKKKQRFKDNGLL